MKKIIRETAEEILEEYTNCYSEADEDCLVKMLEKLSFNVAREIFAEIDEICRKYFNQCSKEPDSELMKMLQQGERFVINEMWHEVAELKKKYESEGNK